MNKNSIIITVVSVIAILGFLIGAYALTNKSAPADYTEINQVKSTDHVTWSPDKKNILVQFTDFECPACRQFHTIMKQFEATGSPNLDIPKKITLVERHFPLYQIHPRAYAGSYAAEAAGFQDKFFQMTDLLFENQETWGGKSDPTELFVGYAKQLGLDSEKFKKDLNSNEVKNRVADDLNQGEKAGIQGTPTFFLNGKKLDNIQSFGDFVKLLKSVK